MIDVKDAVGMAMLKAQEFYADKKLLDLDLEEVEFSEAEKCWLITLGFFVPNLNPTKAFAEIIPSKIKKYDRKYGMLQKAIEVVDTF